MTLTYLAEFFTGWLTFSLAKVSTGGLYVTEPLKRSSKNDF